MHLDQDHLNLDEILRFCDRRDAPEHVQDCEPCRSRLEKARAFEKVLVDDFLENRPFCLGTDELAELPPGAERSHPHLKECPLCRADLNILFQMEAEDRLGVAMSPGFLPSFQGPGAEGLLYQTGEVLEAPLDEGPLRLEQRLEDRRVTLHVAPPNLRVEVSQDGSASLELQLENEDFEERHALRSGSTQWPILRWRIARVVIKG